MRVLGIDTATWRASVGVVDGQRQIAEKCLQTTGNHAAVVLPLIESVLDEAACSPHELDRIVVSHGPGSFTGLRVGLTIAKSLAWATGKPLSTVSTLEALAHAAEVPDGTVAAVLDARKGELYAAVFQVSGGSHRRLTEDLLMQPEELLVHLPGECVIIGDASERYAGYFRDRLGTGVRLLEFPSHGPRGTVVALLGIQQYEYRGTELAAVEPSYIRSPDARIPPP